MDLGRLPLAARVLLVTDHVDAAERAIVRLADAARASVPLRAVAARLTAELAQGALEEARAVLDGREGLAVARLRLAEGDFEGAVVAACEAGRHDLGNPAWLPWRATLALALAPLAARARRELVASGARPRRAAIAGLAALTPRQRQVCELAAAGKSNRAIAHALFLSVKTVESHLARAYGTLGVPDRAGMVASLTG